MQSMINKCINKIIRNILLLSHHFVNFIEETSIITIVMQWITNYFYNTQQNINVDTHSIMYMLLLYAYYSNPFYQSYQLHDRVLLKG
jgi:hypothetical protein